MHHKLDDRAFGYPKIDIITSVPAISNTQFLRTLQQLDDKAFGYLKTVPATETLNFLQRIAS